MCVTGNVALAPRPSFLPKRHYGRSRWLPHQFCPHRWKEQAIPLAKREIVRAADPNFDLVAVLKQK